MAMQRPSEKPIYNTAQSRGFVCSGWRPRRLNDLRDAGRYNALATLRCTANTPPSATLAPRHEHGPCPCHPGRAFSLAELMIAIAILGVGLLVVASTGVVDKILDDQSTTVAELEEVIGKSIRFQREDQYTQEQFDVVLL